MSSITNSVSLAMYQAESRLERATGKLVRAFSTDNFVSDGASLPAGVADVSSAMVDLMQSRTGMAAAVEASRADQEMQGRLLDLLA